MSTTQTRQTKTDWSVRPRTPFGAVVQGTAGLAVASIAGHDLIHLNPLWAVGGTTVGIIGTALVGKDLAPAALAYRLGCWLGAGGWLTWAWANGLWSVESAASLGIGALAATVFAPLAHRTKPRPSVTGSMSGDRPIGGMVVRKHVALAEEWVARLRRVIRVRIQIEQIVEWPNKAGFSALLIQPLGMSSTARLSNAANDLAEDARLPNGCGIEFSPGPYRGSRWMHVAMVNRLKDTIPHPGIRFGKSINDPDAIRLGEHRNTELATVGLRESTMIVAGQKRSGKSGTLHNITGDAAALDDCLVWHMDLNGGGISRLWLRPWLQGRTKRPAIDWAAPCPEEAHLMARALIDIALDRKSAYAELKAEQNVQLLPVSRDIPAILLILDEGKEVLGTKIGEPVLQAIRRALEQLVDIGGNEACNAVLSVLRSVSTALSTDILKQCSTRATMRVFDQSELDYLFGYHRGITPQDAPEQGSGFLQTGADNPRTFKAYYMVPADIDRAAVNIANNRPELDADAVRAAGHAYATRYERMRWLFSTPADRKNLTPPDPIDLPGFENDGPWYPAGNAPLDDDEQGREVAKRRPGHLTLVTKGSVTSGWGDADQVAARRSGGRPPAVTANREPVGRLRAEQVPAVAAASGDTIVHRAIAAFHAAGNDRMHSEDLATALGCTKAELAEQLGRYGVTSLPNPFERGGQRRRGYDLADLIAAADSDEPAGDEATSMELESAQ